MCEILLTVGSPIGQADFAPSLFKYLYLTKYERCIVHIFTANVKQTTFYRIKKNYKILQEVSQNGRQSWVYFFGPPCSVNFLVVSGLHD